MMLLWRLRLDVCFLCYFFCVLHSVDHIHNVVATAPADYDTANYDSGGALDADHDKVASLSTTSSASTIGKDAGATATPDGKDPESYIPSMIDGASKNTERTAPSHIVESSSSSSWAQSGESSVGQAWSPNNPALVELEVGIAEKRRMRRSTQHGHEGDELHDHDGTPDEEKWRHLVNRLYTPKRERKLLLSQPRDGSTEQREQEAEKTMTRATPALDLSRCLKYVQQQRAADDEAASGKAPPATLSKEKSNNRAEACSDIRLLMEPDSIVRQILCFELPGNIAAEVDCTHDPSDEGQKQRNSAGDDRSTATLAVEGAFSLGRPATGGGTLCSEACGKITRRDIVAKGANLGEDQQKNFASKKCKFQDPGGACRLVQDNHHSAFHENTKDCAIPPEETESVTADATRIQEFLSSDAGYVPTRRIPDPLVLPLKEATRALRKTFAITPPKTIQDILDAHKTRVAGRANAKKYEGYDKRLFRIAMADPTRSPSLAVQTMLQQSGPRATSGMYTTNAAGKSRASGVSLLESITERLVVIYASARLGLGIPKYPSALARTVRDLYMDLPQLKHILHATSEVSKVITFPAVLFNKRDDHDGNYEEDNNNEDKSESSVASPTGETDLQKDEAETTMDEDASSEVVRQAEMLVTVRYVCGEDEMRGGMSHEEFGKHISEQAGSEGINKAVETGRSGSTGTVSNEASNTFRQMLQEGHFFNSPLAVDTETEYPEADGGARFPRDRSATGEAASLSLRGNDGQENVIKEEQNREPKHMHEDEARAVHAQSGLRSLRKKTFTERLHALKTWQIQVVFRAKIEGHEGENVAASGGDDDAWVLRGTENTKQVVLFNFPSRKDDPFGYHPVMSWPFLFGHDVLADGNDDYQVEGVDVLGAEKDEGSADGLNALKEDRDEDAQGKKKAEDEMKRQKEHFPRQKKEIEKRRHAQQYWGTTGANRWGKDFGFALRFLPKAFTSIIEDTTGSSDTKGLQWEREHIPWFSVLSLDIRHFRSLLILGDEDADAYHANLAAKAQEVEGEQQQQDQDEAQEASTALEGLQIFSADRPKYWTTCLVAERGRENPIRHLGADTHASFDAQSTESVAIGTYTSEQEEPQLPHYKDPSRDTTTGTSQPLPGQADDAQHRFGSNRHFGFAKTLTINDFKVPRMITSGPARELKLWFLPYPGTSRSGHRQQTTGPSEQDTMRNIFNWPPATSAVYGSTDHYTTEKSTRIREL
ncbi:unnamed protein product [Amoebophrya sp. A25]|nr:unnamed protein product [Amoebophrya sp. A25]|eukprot:GSA25T00012096001.1